METGPGGIRILTAGTTVRRDVADEGNAAAAIEHAPKQPRQTAARRARELAKHRRESRSSTSGRMENTTRIQAPDRSSKGQARPVVRQGLLNALAQDLQRLNSFISMENQRNFAFQQRHGGIDLRSLSRVDLDDLIQNADVEVLQNLLPNVVYSEVREQDLPLFSDHALVKLLRVLQFTVEYMMNMQNSLLAGLEEQFTVVRGLEAELEDTSAVHEQLQSKYSALRRYAKQQKRSLKIYEALLLGEQQETVAAVHAVASQRLKLRKAAQHVRSSGGAQNTPGWVPEHAPSMVETTAITTDVVLAPAAAVPPQAPSSQALGQNMESVPENRAPNQASENPADALAHVQMLQKEHYKEQLQLIRSQLELAEAEAERQRQHAAALADRERSNRITSLEEQLAAAQQENQALALRREELEARSHAEQRVSQIARVMRIFRNRTAMRAWNAWKRQAHTITMYEQRRKHEAAIHEMSATQAKYETLLQKHRAAAARRKQARLKLLHRGPQGGVYSDAEIDYIVQQYTEAREKGLVTSSVEQLMQRMEAGTLDAVLKNSTRVALLQTRIQKAYPRRTFNPIPKHPQVASVWGHPVQKIRVRQLELEEVMSEQLVAIFGFSRQKQRRGRLDKTTSDKFTRLIMRHHDELTSEQISKMQDTAGIVAGVSKEQFASDRHGISFQQITQELRRRQAARHKRYQLDEKLADAMVPILSRKSARRAPPSPGSPVDHFRNSPVVVVKSSAPQKIRTPSSSPNAPISEHSPSRSKSNFSTAVEPAKPPPANSPRSNGRRMLQKTTSPPPSLPKRRRDETKQPSESKADETASVEPASPRADEWETWDDEDEPEPRVATDHDDKIAGGNGVIPRPQMKEMLLRAGMSRRIVDDALDRLYTFRRGDWEPEDFADALQLSGTEFVEIMREIRVPGAASESFRKHFAQDSYWSSSEAPGHTQSEAGVESKSGVRVPSPHAEASPPAHMFRDSPAQRAELTDTIRKWNMPATAAKDEIVAVDEIEEFGDTVTDSFDDLSHYEDTKPAEEPNFGSGDNAEAPPALVMDNSMILEEVDDFGDEFI